MRASLFCCRLWPTSAQKLVPSGSPVYLALFESPLERLIIHTFMAVYVYGSCVDAARAGDLRTLQLLRRDGYPWDRDTCMFAARGGHFDILKWAHENGCKWDSFTCAFAAQHGHFEILKWARENGCEWDRYTCACAAGGGHFEILKWARGQNPPCPWDPNTCANATAGGHFEILKWARENGCEWDSFTCAFAAQRGHLEILEYLYDSRAPFSAKLGITNDKCKAFIEEYGPSWEKGEYRKLTKSQNIKG